MRIHKIEPLKSPEALRGQLPLGEREGAWIGAQRKTVGDLIQGRDLRLLVVVGPCSIHDEEAAREYGQKLGDLARRVESKLFLVMRAYFEKPRTHNDWKGFIADPDLNHSYDVAGGIARARQLMLELTQLKVPLATEFLDPLLPHYFEDLISWGSIGARNAQSQPHRCLASGLPMPIGFKNSTQGLIDPAIQAMASAGLPQRFFGLQPDGRPAVFHTTGNADSHLILRGGRSGPNYHAEAMGKAHEALKAKNLPSRVLVDCNHDNSQKDAAAQPGILKSVLKEAPAGSLLGFMLESKLHAGRQDPYKHPLAYGVSVTDPCLGWKDTQDLLLEVFGLLP